MKRLSLKTSRDRRLGIESPEGEPLRRAQSHRHYPGLRLEVLEGRTLPSTLAFPTAGHLQYSGTAAVASDLTISTDGTNYTFHDAVQTITLDPSAAGWSHIDPNTVAGPNSSITTISIGTSTADDTVSIQSFDNDIAIDGGGGNDTLNITSGVSALDFSRPGVISFGAGQPVINYTNVESIDINKPARPPAGTAVTVGANEGLSLNNVVVATFTESDLGNSPGDFTASIDWGDSTTSAGTIQASGANRYNVLGSHTYTAAGTYPVDVTLIDHGSRGSTAVAGVTNNVTSLGPVNSTPNPIASTADVAVAPLTAQGGTVSGREGIALNPAAGGDVLVATFQDSGTPGAPADYSATIAWGDGSTAAATRIISQGTPNGVVFSVFGNHTYAEEGTYPTAVTITKPASGARAIASGQAVVGDAALTAGAPVALTANTGTSLSNVVVGRFTDANTAAPASDFTASIDWGDGTSTGLGTVVAGATAGTFNVAGTHAYSRPGAYTLKIVVDDVGGSKVTLSGTATATDIAVTGAVRKFTAVEGQDTGTIVLATFTAPNALASVSSVTATLGVNGWGDGTPTSAVPLAVTPIGGTATSTIFQVTGSHRYAEEGPFTVSISVTTSGGATTALTSGTATVVDAPIAATGTSITGIEGNSTGRAVVATFSDANPGATVADFTTGGGSVVVDWGDGSGPQTLPASAVTSSGSANGVLFTVAAAHTYAEEGPYQLTVTITDDGGSKASANGSATIADAALTVATPPPVVSIPEGVLFGGHVGVFHDANPGAPITEFRATIDWGDGSPQSAGTVTRGGTSFLVDGSHTYADSLRVGAPGSGVPGPQDGTYPITIYVTDVGGSQLTIANTATVTDEPLTVTGRLDPASDSGASDTDNITNIVQPNFFGTTSEPAARVSLFAQAAGAASPVPIGQGTADATGAWSIASNRALADGSYAITAIAVDEFGHTISNTTTIVPNLVVDTIGPKVTDVSFRRFRGQIRVRFQDYGGPDGAGVGLEGSTEIDANNYRLESVHHPRLGAFRVNVVSVVPGTTTGVQTATLSINKGHFIRGGWYFFTIRSVSPSDLTGIQDLAGNALDGEFYGYFPSGNNRPGGDFVAQLTAIHHTIFAPATVVGRATPVSPPGTRGRNITVPITINPSQLPGRVVPVERGAAASRVRIAAPRAVGARHRAGLLHLHDGARDGRTLGRARRS